MNSNSFEEFFATLGRKMDEMAASYRQSATHKVVLKQGDRTVSEMVVPLEPVKAFFEKTGAAIGDAASQVKQTVGGAVKAVADLRVEVHPLHPQEAPAEPKDETAPPPDAPPPDAPAAES